jgi:hypothetical protein
MDVLKDKRTNIKGETSMERKELKAIDADNYLGETVQIISARYINSKFGSAVKMTSNVIPLKEGDSLPDGKVLTASRIFSLGVEDDEVFVPIDGQLDVFLKSKKIRADSLPEFEVDTEIPALLGVKCKVQKNKKGYLELV